MDVQTRTKIIDRYRYCENCLAKSHDLRACPSMDTCRICGKYHHTLLHPNIRSRLSKRKPSYRNAARSSKQLVTAAAAPSSTHRGSSSKSSTASNPQRRSSTPTTKNQPQQQPTINHVPDQRILSEAIRSLAQVLCNQHSPPDNNSYSRGRNV